MIGTMVGDVLQTTAQRVRQLNVATIDGVRSAGGPLAGFSEALAAEERQLKAFLYAKLYDAPQLRAVRDEAERIIANLASAYRDDPSLLPEPWQRAGERANELRTIGDFIAGMTDRYAIARHQELIGPVNLPADHF
jgi:dGTPase